MKLSIVSFQKHSWASSSFDFTKSNQISLHSHCPNSGYTAAAPIAYAGHAVAPAALPAAAPVAYANAALPAVYGGVYGATYDPSVAYANLCEYYLQPSVYGETLQSDL